jgi:hypothetical protein
LHAAVYGENLALNTQTGFLARRQRRGHPTKPGITEMEPATGKIDLSVSTPVRKRFFYRVDSFCHREQAFHFLGS